jgi:hypothetical protein
MHGQKKHKKIYFSVTDDPGTVNLYGVLRRESK